MPPFKTPPQHPLRVQLPPLAYPHVHSVFCSPHSHSCPYLFSHLSLGYSSRSSSSSSSTFSSTSTSTNTSKCDTRYLDPFPQFYGEAAQNCLEGNGPPSVSWAVWGSKSHPQIKLTAVIQRGSVKFRPCIQVMALHAKMRWMMRIRRVPYLSADFWGLWPLLWRSCILGANRSTREETIAHSIQ